MKTLEMIGYRRTELGKRSSKQLREEANVPCVLYGGDEEIHFHTPMFLFRDLVYTPDVHKVLMNIEGDEFECILQDIQFHPVSEVILHADFLRLFDDREVKMSIPVHFTGNSPGIQQGGKLLAKLKKIKVKGLPNNLPDFIEVDISHLDLGKSVKVSEIKPEGYQIMVHPSNPIASIEIPRALRSKQGQAAAEES